MIICLARDYTGISLPGFSGHTDFSSEKSSAIETTEMEIFKVRPPLSGLLFYLLDIFFI